MYPLRRLVNFNLSILFWALFLTLSSITSCTTSPKRDFEKIQVGMDKADVLELMGNPKRTRRWKGKDEWIYRFYDNNQEVQKKLVFELGRVIEIAEFSDRPTPQQELQDASTWEEYESAAKKIKSNPNQENKAKESLR